MSKKQLYNALKNALIKELKKGEKSGFIENHDRKDFIKNLHDKYVNAEL